MTLQQSIIFLFRLRGLKYTTWEDESKVFPVKVEEGGAPTSLPAGSLVHHKFQNYRFDPEEFLAIMARLEAQVRLDPRYLEAVEEGVNAKDEL